MPDKGAKRPGRAQIRGWPAKCTCPRRGPDPCHPDRMHHLRPSHVVQRREARIGDERSLCQDWQWKKELGANSDCLLRRLLRSPPRLSQVHFPVMRCHEHAGYTRMILDDRRSATVKSAGHSGSGRRATYLREIVGSSWLRARYGHPVRGGSRGEFRAPGRRGGGCLPSGICAGAAARYSPPGRAGACWFGLGRRAPMPSDRGCRRWRPGRRR